MDIANSTRVSANGKYGTGGPEFDKPAPETSAKNPRRRWLIGIGALIAASLIGAAWAYYSNAAGYEATDDAFIEGHIVQLSPEVSGNVLSMYINDNQMVKKNDMVVELDPRDFQARVAQARAALGTATAQVDLAWERLAQAQAQVVAAQAEATRAGTDEGRLAVLFHQQLIARQELDHGTADARSTAAQLAAARANVQAQAAALGEAKSQVADCPVFFQ